MSLDSIKGQLLTIFAIKGETNVFLIIYSIVMLSVLEVVMKHIPELIEYGKKKFAKKVQEVTIQKIAPKVKSRICFERNYKTKNKDNIADAILSYLSTQDSSQDLMFLDFYLINKRDEFEINSDVKIQVQNINFNSDVLEYVKFQVFSYTLTLSKLRAWCDGIEKNFEIEKKNNFGNKRYFFTEHTPDINLGANQPPSIHFTMTEFNSNKSLMNVYGSHVNVVRHRVKFFIENEAWYKKKGIPYTLGILLYGPPGTGKTSLIKAIAKDTNRHIFSIRLSETSTRDQFNNLFYSEVVNTKLDNKQASVIVPLEQRIYVFEDIDCLSKVVLKRDSDEKASGSDFVSLTKKILSNDERYDADLANKKKLLESSKKIDLNFLLNLFDGILETPGRIMIMTTNHPDKLDPALVRPGRIDINLELGFCTSQLVQEIFTGFFGPNDYKFENLEGKNLTPAKIQEIFCNNIDDIEKAYQKIMN